jgi:hypothetical protein
LTRHSRREHHGNANIGAASAGVIDAVSTATAGLRRRSVHRSTSAGRNAIRQHAIQVERGSDGLRGSRAIASDHPDALAPAARSMQIAAAHRC